jgi:hypothetical protein
VCAWAWAGVCVSMLSAVCCSVSPFVLVLFVLLCRLSVLLCRLWIHAFAVFNIYIRAVLFGLWWLYCCAVVSSVYLLCRLWVHAYWIASAVFNIYIFLQRQADDLGPSAPRRSDAASHPLAAALTLEPPLVRRPPPAFQLDMWCDRRPKEESTGYPGLRCIVRRARVSISTSPHASCRS